MSSMQRWPCQLPRWRMTIPTSNCVEDLWYLRALPVAHCANVGNSFDFRFYFVLTMSWQPMNSPEGGRGLGGGSVCVSGNQEVELGSCFPRSFCVPVLCSSCHLFKGVFQGTWWYSLTLCTCRSVTSQETGQTACRTLRIQTS